MSPSSQLIEGSDFELDGIFLFFSVEKKNVCCPLSEALALGRQQESLLVRTGHTAPRASGAPAELPLEGRGLGQPVPSQKGWRTVLPISAGAGDSPPSFSLTPLC